MDSGSTQLGEPAATVQKYGVVDVRLALVREAAGWQVRYGEVVLGAERAAGKRTWRYPVDTFVQRRLPGPVVAGLLREEPQGIADIQVTTPTPQNTANYHRLAGQVKWNHVVLPWPRTEWDISWPHTPPTRPQPMLVGDGPSSVHSEAAFCAFFHAAEWDHNLVETHRLWRIVQLDQRAWIHRARIHRVGRSRNGRSPPFTQNARSSLDIDSASTTPSISAIASRIRSLIGSSSVGAEKTAKEMAKAERSTIRSARVLAVLDRRSQATPGSVAPRREPAAFTRWALAVPECWPVGSAVAAEDGGGNAHAGHEKQALQEDIPCLVLLRLGGEL
jgi:hypothetical protein